MIEVREYVKRVLEVEYIVGDLKIETCSWL